MGVNFILEKMQILMSLRFNVRLPKRRGFWPTANLDSEMGISEQGQASTSLLLQFVPGENLSLRLHRPLIFPTLRTPTSWGFTYKGRFLVSFEPFFPRGLQTFAYWTVRCARHRRYKISDFRRFITCMDVTWKPPIERPMGNPVSFLLFQERHHRKF